MVRRSTISIFLLCLGSFSFGQHLDAKDSLALMSQVKAVFELFKNPVLSDFEKSSTEEIYCIPCDEGPDTSEDPYMYDRRAFFDNHMKELGRSGWFNRAMHAPEVILVEQHDPRTDILVLFTVYKEGELAPVHEGGQLGLHFKKVNNAYKFAGIETTP